MRMFPESLTAHVGQTSTTLCSCWIVTRRDGVTLGFTDHDRTLILNGVECEPETGLMGSGIESSVGLNVDSWSADGILSSDAITDDDLKTGLYDRAIIEQWLVNWQNTDEAQRLSRAVMGEVSIADNRYTIELRSISALLERDQTRFFGAECDAELGDERCGANRSLHSVAATIVSTRENNRLRVESASTVDAALFINGTLTLPDGRAARLLQVNTPTNNQTLDIVLDRALGKLTADMSVTLTQGCDKQFATCRERFANSQNFRGFPHIPGGENTLNYADEEGEYNGEPLVR